MTELHAHDIIVIGASAGGVDALRALFSTIPDDLHAALFVVMHLAEGQANFLAGIIAQETALPVANAIDQERIRMGRVYIAVADHQMTVLPGIIRILPTERRENFRPSVDALFESAAMAYGPRVAGVVLTGRLRDGTLGLRRISAHGGVTIIQTPDEASHPSMPISALKGDHVRYSLPAQDIGALLGRLATPGSSVD